MAGLRPSPARAAVVLMASPERNVRQNERPVRGDNRTGQAIWALGVDGRSRQIQPRWGGITAPTDVGRNRGAARSNPRAIFLTLFGGRFSNKAIAQRGDRHRRQPIFRTPSPAKAGP